ncbi:MAG: peroxidase-related enzyme [Myxococcales bacterium]|nr:peroxidase-related enzyme [Myxococcales bacterium]
MTRVALIEEARPGNDRVAVVFDQIRRELGFGMVPNLFRSMAPRPAFLEAQWALFRGTVLVGGLPRTLKEMVGILISQANDSRYALMVHLHSLSALGISEEVLKLLVEDFENCPLPAREKAALAFGRKVGVKAGSVTDADFADLKAHGLSEADVMELIATAVLFSGVNRYTDAINLAVDGE